MCVRERVCLYVCDREAVELVMATETTMQGEEERGYVRREEVEGEG